MTLLELAIVLVTIAILAAIAWPAYQGQGLRARSQEGQQALADARARMEQHFLNTHAYTDGPCSTSVTAGLFTIVCPSAPTAQAYTITATGSGVASGLTYSIDHHGTQRTTALPSAWGSVPTGGYTCWISRQGDTC